MSHFHFSGGSEEDVNNKMYDKVLFKRLIQFLKPYKIQVLISFLLLLLIAAAELTLPYITKVAVDDLIASKKSLLVFEIQNEKDEFIQKYKRVKFQDLHYNNKFYLVFSNTKQRYFEKGTIEELEKSDRFYQNILVLDNTDQNKEILKDTEPVEISSQKMAVLSSELNDLKTTGQISKLEMKILRSSDISKLKVFGIIFFSIIILQFIFTYFQIFTVNYAAQNAMYDLRLKLFSHLEKMPLSFFDKNPVGRLVTRVTNDVRTLDEMLSEGLIKLIQDIFVLFGIIIMMLILNWKLALVTFTILPFLITLLIVFKNKVRSAYRVVRKKVASINSALSEDISGVKIIQLFNRFAHKKKTFAKINNEYYQASMRQMRIFASFRPVIHSLRRVVVAILVWYGLGQVLENYITLGIFMAFMSYVDRFFEPIDQLSEKFNILQAAMSGAERIFDLMDKPIERDKDQGKRIKEAGDRKTDKGFQGEIEFRNVWLQYKENEDVLKDVSFKVKAGEKIALVGHTGSGKTSIISLISGLYPFQKGEIKIDGKDIQEYSLNELRGNVGIVQQDVFLFSGTIKENIVLNDESISDERMQEVSQYVNVHKFIDKLPKKYNDPVMERGATFSVGQRQLFAFARVLAYNPAIFVLDEATSNIDTETEILIQDALQKLMENRTSIIIAHRLSTIQHVDRILVLHKGEIREEGTHQELLAKEGLYYDLYRLQYL
ncbi:MAG: ABC transporter ATP-binding protein [Candidatus Cloacimonetes bacterium]|nr:ABC transporter ATP-binding protein [Candidatus Cloacimonadota bacterium]